MGEATSKRTKPAYSRAFLTTTAFIGAINAAFFLYFLSLPDDGSIFVIGEWGSWSVKGRVIPDWFAPVEVMNFPGALIGGVCLWIIGQSLPNQVASFLFAQVAGTLFWGWVAIIVEFAWTRKQILFSAFKDA